ncbi:DUF4174 domain-containing protein [Pararhodobacter sp.]|uniref:DUF4174 domain-containing protein n=1 Tax=Pararhodobacter sp. TaxID=2127056 RepID=UPI002AFFF3DE|nr:DUF4174 domain-containing protein [Pararhodobacter sp.]
MPMKFMLIALIVGAVAMVSATAQEVANPAAGTAPVETVVETPVAGLQILDAAQIDPADFLWEYRIVAVLADSPNDPAFQRQMRDIAERPGELFERDVVVIIDSDRNSDSPLRRMLRPRGFMLAIIGKDGQIKQRRPAPRSVREIASAIDHFPLRRQEILERMPAGR